MNDGPGKCGRGTQVDETPSRRNSKGILCGWCGKGNHGQRAVEKRTKRNAVCPINMVVPTPSSVDKVLVSS